MPPTLGISSEELTQTRRLATSLAASSTKEYSSSKASSPLREAQH